MIQAREGFNEEEGEEERREWEEKRGEGETKEGKEWSDRNFIKNFLLHSSFNLDVISFNFTFFLSWESVPESIHHHQIGWQSREERERKYKKERIGIVKRMSEREERRRESESFLLFCLSISFPILWPQFCIHLLMDWGRLQLIIWCANNNNTNKGKGESFEGMRVKNYPEKLIIIKP